MQSGDDQRLAAVERKLDLLLRRSGEPRRPDKRDGRAVLSIRVGDETAALVRRAARQRGITISDLVRSAILAAVNQPSTDQTSERLVSSVSFAPRTLPRDATRGAISNSLADRARLTAAGAATIADNRSRDQLTTTQGMMTEAMAPRSLRLR